MDEPFEIKYWGTTKEYLKKLEADGLVNDVEKKMLKFRMSPESKGVPFITVNNQLYYRTKVTGNKKYQAIYHVDREKSIVTLPRAWIKVVNASNPYPMREIRQPKAI